MSQCCDADLRRAALHADPDWNGLDYVEVEDNQTTLCAYFFGRLPPELTGAGQQVLRHLRIEGGRRIRDIRITGVEAVRAASADQDDRLFIYLSHYGDFSTYTLHLVDLPSIDQRYASAGFSFKAACPGEIDCGACAPEAVASEPAPLLNYLAKDYASFRQLLHDRMALLVPDWQERHVPDLGITLIEVLAYCADQLSYYQDAVATEAYLATARQRISVRRHARLVDYHLHEGCNARAWLALTVGSDVALPLAGTAFITGLNQSLTGKPNPLRWQDLSDIPESQYEVFEPLWPQQAGALALYQAHNAIDFYTWGGEMCTLAQGSTSASLQDGWASAEGEQRSLHLQVGDVLIFEAVADARTGLAVDASPALRHAVRLTACQPNFDPLLRLPDGRPTPVLDISWSVQDALPFCLPLSSLGPAPDCRFVTPLAVARGNVLLVDHGKTLDAQPLGQVALAQSDMHCHCEGQADEVQLGAAPFHPQLAQQPLTHAEPLPQDPPPPALDGNDQGHDSHHQHHQHHPHRHPRHRKHGHHGHHKPHTIPAPKPHGSPASRSSTDALPDQNFPGAADTPWQAPARLVPACDFFAREVRAALPQIELTSQAADAGELWQARYDLIGSAHWERHFVVETDNAGVSHLRFGDGELGLQPQAGHRFSARYRVGNGVAGNVGAGAISHIVLADLLSGVSISARNPLPARGGATAETMADARMLAPYAFKKTIERAIIAEDYQTLAERNRQLQRAAAELVWTGSWNEAVVSIDPYGTEQVEPELLQELDRFLQRYRRMGHDLRVRPARYVPLDLALSVCVLPGYQRAHVLATLQAVFGSGLTADGQRGFFHPDNLSFGSGIYLSQLVALGQAQAGVECVNVTRLQRQFQVANGELASGVLRLQSWEIAQLDNDPNFPEHGKLVIQIHGGR